MLAVRISYGRLYIEDVLVPLSFLLAAVLIALSTWAIVSEGQGLHQDDISVSQLNRVAKVSTLKSNIATFTYVIKIIR